MKSMTMKEMAIEQFLSSGSPNEKSGILKDADELWEKSYQNARALILPEDLEREITDAAYTLAGDYHMDGLQEGFTLACRVFGELFAEMVKGGARA